MHYLTLEFIVVFPQASGAEESRTRSAHEPSVRFLTEEPRSQISGDQVDLLNKWLGCVALWEKAEALTSTPHHVQS